MFTGYFCFLSLSSDSFLVFTVHVNAPHDTEPRSYAQLAQQPEEALFTVASLQNRILNTLMCLSSFQSTAPQSGLPNYTVSQDTSYLDCFSFYESSLHHWIWLFVFWFVVLVSRFFFRIALCSAIQQSKNRSNSRPRSVGEELLPRPRLSRGTQDAAGIKTDSRKQPVQWAAVSGTGPSTVLKVSRTTTVDNDALVVEMEAQLRHLEAQIYL